MYRHFVGITNLFACRVDEGRMEKLDEVGGRIEWETN